MDASDSSRATLKRVMESIQLTRMHVDDLRELQARLSKSREAIAASKALLLRIDRERWRQGR